MRRVAVVLGLVAAMLPLSVRPAWAACECVGAPTSPRDQAREAHVVFTGVVSSITTPASFAHEAFISFNVSTVYEGGSGSTVTVTTPIARGSCHFDFLPRVRYTVFADEDLSTGACSGNVRGVINAEGYGLVATPVTAGSGPFEVERSTDLSTPAWVAGVIGFVLLVAGAIGLVARRTRLS